VSVRVNLNGENRPVIFCSLRESNIIHFGINQERELAFPQKTSDYLSIAKLRLIIN